MKMKKLLFPALFLCYALPLLSVELPSPELALEMLKEGNIRFYSETPLHPNIDKERRKLTTEDGQHPFATVIACSDSRVPVEMIFDQGIGDVFVIKVAGNVCDVDEIGSIEYGVDHLGTPILVILGHSHCGAVTAVCTDAEVHGSIPQLVDNIIPAVESVKEDNPGVPGQELVPDAVRANVFLSIDDLLKNSKATRERIKEKQLMVVGAVYDIKTGMIEWLGKHPKQTKMLAEYKGDGGHHAAAPAAHGEEAGAHAVDSSHVAQVPVPAKKELNVYILIGVVVLSSTLVFFGIWGLLKVIRKK